MVIKDTQFLVKTIDSDEQNVKATSRGWCDDTRTWYIGSLALTRPFQLDRQSSLVAPKGSMAVNADGLSL